METHRFQALKMSAKLQCQEGSENLYSGFPLLLLFGDQAGSLGHIYLITTLIIMIIINKLTGHLLWHSMCYGLNYDPYKIHMLKS